MSTTQSESDPTADAESEPASGTVELLKTLGATVLVAGWSLFWGNLARLHYTQGDMVSAVFTAATLVVPAVAAWLWYAAESHGFDVPTPDVDTDVIGS